MAPQQLPADSLSAWPREAACIISTVAVDATPVLSSGHKDFVVQRSLFYELVSLVCLFSDHSEIELSGGILQKAEQSKAPRLLKRARLSGTRRSPKPAMKVWLP